MTLQNIIALFRKQTVQPVPMLDIMQGMAERNAARIAKIKEEMGEKWLHHPANKKTRLDEPRPV